MAPNLNPQLGLLLFFIFIVSLTSPIAATTTSDAPTVYEILPKFGLPSGLLPDSVQSYSLDADGTFVVELANTCYIQFDYLVYYEKRISGLLKYGSITKLHGIQVQRLLLWFDVDEIRVDLPPSDSIYFQVGFINKRLDVGQFQTVRSCRHKASNPVFEIIYCNPLVRFLVFGFQLLWMKLKCSLWSRQQLVICSMRGYHGEVSSNLL